MEETSPRAVAVRLPIDAALQFFRNTVKSPCQAFSGVVRTSVIHLYTVAVLSPACRTVIRRAVVLIICTVHCLNATTQLRVTAS